MSDVVASTTAFVEPGIYQRLACGCVLTAHDFDPNGPRLCLIGNEAGPCGTDHAVDDFMPRRCPA